MIKKSKKWVLLTIFFVATMTFLAAAFITNGFAKAEVIWSPGTNPGGGRCGESDNLYWDTCFGLSWQYYKWPKDSNGNAIDDDVVFWCTPGTAPDYVTCQKAGYGVTVEKKCASYGGFWFLGYHAYSPSDKYASEVPAPLIYIKNSDGSLTAYQSEKPRIGLQVGPPKVSMLSSWVTYGTGVQNGGNILYPFGSASQKSVVFKNYSKEDIAKLTHKDLEKGIEFKYTYEDSAGRRITADAIAVFKPAICNTSISNGCPKLKSSSRYVNPSYFGTTNEVFKSWNAQAGPAGVTNFSQVNWFCAGDPEDEVEGNTSVYAKKSGQSAVFRGESGWADVENYSATYDDSNIIEVSPSESFTIYFYHRLRGSFSSAYSINGDGGNLVSNDYAPESGVLKEKYVGGSREVVVSYDDSSWDVNNSRKLCDTLSYDDISSNTHTRTACVTLKKVNPQIDVEVKSDVQVKQSATETKSSGYTTSSAKTKEETLNVDVRFATNEGNKTKNVKVNFRHNIKPSKESGVIDKTYKILRCENANCNNDNWSTVKDTTVYSKTVTSASEDTVYNMFDQFNPGEFSKDLSFGDTYKVCEKIVIGDNERVSKVCVNITTSAVEGDVKSQSQVTISDQYFKPTNNNSNKTASTAYATRSNTSPAAVTLKGIYELENSAGSVNVKFSHILTNTAGYIKPASYKVYDNNGNEITSLSGTKDFGNKILADNASPVSKTDEISVPIDDGQKVTVCESFVVTYNSTDRTTTICAEITGKYTTMVQGESEVVLKAGSDEKSASQISKVGGAMQYVYSKAETGLATFGHDVYIKSRSGLSIDYSITNDLNSAKNTTGTAVGNAEGKYTGSYNRENSIKEGDGWMCETLNFPYESKSYESTVCAFIDFVDDMGEEGCPAIDPNRSTPYSITYIRRSVKNGNDYTAVGGWVEGTIYGKPTDKINFRHCYYPGNPTLQTFNVGNLNVDSVMSNNYSLSLDGSFRTDFKNNDGYVQFNGNQYVKTYAVVNTKESDKNTVKANSVDVSVRQALYQGTGHSAESSAAQAVIPYNYRTSGEVQLSGDYVYAGSEVKITNAKVTVNKRENGKVGETYATRTPSTTVRLYMLQNGTTPQLEGGYYATNNVCSLYGVQSCEEISTVNNKVYNANGDLNGGTEAAGFNVSTGYNIPDVKAGTVICFGMSIYPAQSTDTTAIDGTTYVAKPVCKTVAKRPSFQLWGGSLFVNGNITTSETIKRFEGNTTTVPRTGGTTVTFGSWVEDSVIAMGEIKGISSGAATGYSNTYITGGYRAEAPNSNSYCGRSILTFSNSSCAQNRAGGFGTVTNSREMKDDIKNTFIKNITNSSNGITPVNGTSVDISQSGNYQVVNNVRYTLLGSNATIYASSELPKGVTHVIYSSSNIAIGSNLIYQDSNLSSLTDIPQYIIVSDKSIVVRPEVTRIDAVIDAGKKFATCSLNNFNDNVGECHNQLRINGMIISGSMSLGRTYGAGVGVDTITPAEIINFIPTTYDWQLNANSGSSITTSTHASYRRELAPRQ